MWKIQSIRTLYALRKGDNLIYNLSLVEIFFKACINNCFAVEFIRKFPVYKIHQIYIALYH